MMKREECLRVLAEHRSNEIVIGAMLSGRDWEILSPSDLNFRPDASAMGISSSFGLGLALALPHRRIIVLDGDGSLLMNLGSLVTIAHLAPKNLIHIVCENGKYEASGNQPTVGAGTMSFRSIAKAAGIDKSYEFDNLDNFRDEIPRIVKEDGPIFIVLKVIKGEPLAQASSEFSFLESRHRFKRALEREIGEINS